MISFIAWTTIPLVGWLCFERKSHFAGSLYTIGILLAALANTLVAGRAWVAIPLALLVALHLWLLPNEARRDARKKEQAR